jgi:hypothetical protein
MGVGGIGGRSGPVEREPEPVLPALDRVEGQRDEAEMRRGLETVHGGLFNRAAGIVDDVLSLAHIRPLTPRIPQAGIRELPSFVIEGKDGTLVKCELDEVEGADGKKRAGVCFEWKPLGEPGLRFKWAEGQPATLYGDLMREVPLSLRHAIAARGTLETIERYVKAATQPGAPLGPGATPDEVRRAGEILGRIEAELGALEGLMARSPEARLAADVYARLGARKLDDTKDLEKVIQDLAAAGTSVMNRSTLSPAERRMVESEIFIVRQMAQEWRSSSVRTGTYS